MVRINSTFVQNITENLPALSETEIGKLSARSIYRIASAPGIGQQECAEKVRELSALVMIKAVKSNLIVRFFQRIKNWIGSSHRWKTDQQLLTLALDKFNLLRASELVFERTKAAAEAGDADAQFQLGELYVNGEGVEKDLQEAFRWHKEAAKQGLAQAQHVVGLSYRRGHGVEQNIEKATKWYQRAAEQNGPAFMYIFGHFLNEEGRQDEAIKWYEKAAALGHQWSIEELNSLRPPLTLSSEEESSGQD